MKQITSFFSVFLTIALLAALLSGCSEALAPHDPNEDVLNVTQVVTQADINQLELYPNLQTADLRGSDCYRSIMTYAATHPNVAVHYDVAIGSDRYDMNITELGFSADQANYDDLLTNLEYLPKVTSVDLPDTAMTFDQLETLKSKYSKISFTYTVSIAGSIYEADTTEVDLTQLQATDMESAAHKLSLLPNVSRILLTKEDGTNNLTPADVKTLQQLVPNAFVEYSFDLFGKTVSTSDEVIEYDEVAIGNEGEQQIREALDILTSCRYIKFDDCGIDTAVMAGIRDDYPEVKVVWRIHINQYSLLTDETMMRLTFTLDDKNIDELKYCTDVVYMDIGHNNTLTDVSFVAYMPNLECAILSGSRVTDISAFANCKKLVWLELCFCGYFEDLSPIKDIDSLKYLNVSGTKAKDFTPLDNLKLERFVCMSCGASIAEKNRFVEKHPDCLSVLKGKQPYGYGWRYDDHGYTFFEYYRNMREIFRYADKNYRGNRKE